jgi:hypothetical protein
VAVVLNIAGGKHKYIVGKNENVLSLHAKTVSKACYST